MTGHIKIYRCLACSYQGKRFPQGNCPACGAANIHRIIGGDADPAVGVKPAYTLWLCIALWVLLLFAIYKKLTA